MFTVSCHLRRGVKTRLFRVHVPKVLPPPPSTNLGDKKKKKNLLFFFFIYKYYLKTVLIKKGHAEYLIHFV